MITINIDFGAPGSGPPSTFGAAGSPGIWNVVDRITTAGIDGGPIVDINGKPTGLTITTSRTLVDVTPTAQPFSLADTPLLGDYLVGSTSFSMNIMGLPDGLYAFVVYTVGRQDFPSAMTVTPDGDASSAKTTTGVYQSSKTGNLQEGITHSTFIRSVDGTGISFGLAPGDGFINGLQITPVPEPSSGLMLGAVITAIVLRRTRPGEQAVPPNGP